VCERRLRDLLPVNGAQQDTIEGAAPVVVQPAPPPRVVVMEAALPEAVHGAPESACFAELGEPLSRRGRALHRWLASEVDVRIEVAEDNGATAVWYLRRELLKERHAFVSGLRVARTVAADDAYAPLDIAQVERVERCGC
jgi:hypothetical protein